MYVASAFRRTFGEVRLKPDATSTGPAKAGRHVYRNTSLLARVAHHRRRDHFLAPRTMRYTYASGSSGAGHCG